MSPSPAIWSLGGVVPLVTYSHVSSARHHVQPFGSSGNSGSSTGSARHIRLSRSRLWATYPWLELGRSRRLPITAFCSDAFEEHDWLVRLSIAFTSQRASATPFPRPNNADIYNRRRWAWHPPGNIMRPSQRIGHSGNKEITDTQDGTAKVLSPLACQEPVRSVAIKTITDVCKLNEADSAVLVLVFGLNPIAICEQPLFTDKLRDYCLSPSVWKFIVELIHWLQGPSNTAARASISSIAVSSFSII